MPLQSNIQFGMVAPANVPTPSNGYYAVFIADGSQSTVAGQMYRKDHNGVVSLNQSQVNDFSVAKARDAVGGSVQNSDTVQLLYDSTNRLITAYVKTGSVGTTHLTDAAVTNAKLASMPAATFKMRTAGSGSGAPVDGTAVQAKAALGIGYADVTGLGTAAQLNADAFDTAGAAAAARAASQPLDDDLTAMSGIGSTAYGRSLLTLANAAALTAAQNLATYYLKGLLSPADKVKLDSKGALATLTSPQPTGIALFPSLILSATVPANMPAGQAFLLRCAGHASSSSTMSFRVHAGPSGSTSDSVVWTSVSSGSMSTNQRAGFDGMLTLRTSGANAVVQCECNGFANTVTLPAASGAPTTSNVNSTIPWFITLSSTVSLFGGYTAQQAMITAL